VDDGSHGTEREARVRRIASELDVADFVFTCPLVTKGGGASREIRGDGLLVVGEVGGAILLVKARDPQRAEVDSPERAARWISKNVAGRKRREAELAGRSRVAGKRVKQSH
jgi:hypothetical protein